jgi:hypothetical protein
VPAGGRFVDERKSNTPIVRLLMIYPPVTDHTSGEQ